MRKNKLIQWAYVACVMIFCTIPVYSMLLVQIDNDPANEKRELSSFPELKVEGDLNLLYFQGVDNYLNDHFNFRTRMIQWNTQIWESMCGISSVEQVIMGKDGWLYFDKTLDDYQNIDSLDSVDIKRIAKIIELIEEYTIQRGCEFTFTIAPNKNSLYPEYMPRNYISLDAQSNAQQLHSYLNKVNYLNLFEIFGQEEEDLYFKKDTHWNNKGAYLAYLAMLDSWSIEDTGFVVEDIQVRDDYEGDLAAMLYPDHPPLDEEVYYEFDREFVYTSRFRSMEDLLISTRCEEAEGSVYVFRDSFGNALLEYFGRGFQEVTFSRALPYNIEKAITSDNVLIEIVERNLPLLLEGAPIMPAPIRNEELLDADSKFLELATINEIQTKQVAGYQYIYGTIDDEFNSFQEIYINIDDTLYECFPIIDSDFEVDDSEGILGFACYIENEEIEVLDSIQVFVSVN